MKLCKVCNIEKDNSQFGKLKSSKDGLNYYCKICHSKKMSEYRNTEVYKAKRKENYIINRDFYLEQKKEYYINNIDKIKEKDKKYYNDNKEDILLKKKKYREDNKISISEYLSEYRKNNIQAAIIYQKEYRKNRNELDKIFKFSNNIRSLIKISIKKSQYIKKSKSFDILGLCIYDFMLYLESKFEPWMTWENYGLYNGELNYGWDIDHIIPLSSATTEKELIKLCHYTNLQPLCSYTNRYIKRDNISYCP